MWNYVDSNKIVGTEMKVQVHRLHMANLANTKSTIKGLTPWRPKHSLSKIKNKYTAMRNYETNKQNSSLLTRMLELESKPVAGYTINIPEHIPSNTKTHKVIKDYERRLERLNLNNQNKKILKRIESAYSLYGRSKWKQEWKSIKNYRSNIVKKEIVPDYAELARSRQRRPRTAHASDSPQRSQIIY